MRNTENNSLIDLPDEILLPIFQSLSAIELAELQLVNKRFNNLVTPLLWKSIYVYRSSKEVRAGLCWFDYWWMSLDTFLGLARSQKLKYKFMEKIIFYSDHYLSVEWFKWLKREIPQCCIGFSKITKQATMRWRCECDMAPTIRWTWLNYYYLKGPVQYQPEEPHIYTSIRIESPDQSFYDNWLPLFTLLKALYIDKPSPFYVNKKICLTHLFLGNATTYGVSVNTSILENFDLLSLVSLLIPEVTSWKWVQLSQLLFAIKEIQLSNSIKDFPLYSLRELHYHCDIPKEDFKFLPRHEITYLSAYPTKNNNGTYTPNPPNHRSRQKRTWDMNQLDNMKKLRKLKLDNLKYQVVKTYFKTLYVEMSPE